MNRLIQDIFLAFSEAYRSLTRNKLRSGLTMLGIVVGIAAIMMVLSAGEGIKSYIVGQVTQFGTDYIQTEVKVPNTAHTSSENATGQAQGVTITTLTLDDMEAIRKLPNIRNTYAAMLGQKVVTYREINSTVFLFGTSASFIDIDPGEIAEGRFYTDDEDKSLARVIVLGADAKEKLFGDGESVGKYVKMNRQNYRVIGVMERRGASAFFNMDEMVFVPVQTLQRLIQGIRHVSFIYSQVQDPSLSAVTADDIRVLLRERHDITDPDDDDFAVATSQEALDILGTVVGGIRILLLAIGAISLIVGGVGILNIMFVAVTERTFEIGIRKAVGASQGDILIQFLCESVFMTFVGGAIGVAAGIALSSVAALVATSAGFDWQYTVSPLYIVIACGVSVAVGMAAGLYPARKAARLDPIVALRNEQ